MKQTMKKLQAELDTMRARLDELRVQGSLGKMELKDKLAEYKSALEPSYEKAKSTLAAVTHSGAEESKTMAKSLAAGWEALRKTHKELSLEADSERERVHQAKRKS